MCAHESATFEPNLKITQTHQNKPCKTNDIDNPHASDHRFMRPPPDGRENVASKEYSPAQTEAFRNPVLNNRVRPVTKRNSASTYSEALTQKANDSTNCVFDLL